MKKVVLKLDLQEDRDKRRALKTVSTLSGIDEITINMKERKLTVIGTVDPVRVVSKLRKKNWQVDIISVGPSKEPEKEEEKKDKAKKDEAKKEEGKEEAKKEEAKKEDEKKEEPKKAESDLVVGTAMPFRQYYPPMSTYYYAHHSMEENPNVCVIC